MDKKLNIRITTVGQKMYIRITNDEQRINIRITTVAQKMNIRITNDKE